MSKLTILGSGTAFSSFYRPFDFRYPSGYLLQHNNKNYLIDCSEGIRERLEKLKIDYYSINNIFISHFHPDHFNLHTLIQSFQVRNFYTKKTSQIRIFGPPETEKRFQVIWDATHFTESYKNFLPQQVKLEFIEYKNGEKIDVDSFSLTPFQVNHGNMPAFALRFEIENKTLIYSGDSGLCPGIETASKRADLFICEANEKIGSNNPGHLSVNQVGEISGRNGVKTVVLTHLTGIHSDEELKKAVENTGFKGKIKIASDFMTVSV